MSDAPVLLTRDGGIATVTLNRGDNRNSMTPELLDSFAGVMAEVIADDDLRCVVITGNGTCFSAGADFKSNLQRFESSKLPHERSFAMYEPFLRVLDVRVPVIAAMNGHAVGGGFGLSLLCDIRIANRDAKYGANFARLGIHPGLGISFLLPRLIGLTRASELLYTGRLIRGEEAVGIGLASSCHSGDQVLERSLEMARTIADNAPLAVRLCKESIRDSLAWDIRAAARREAFAQATTVATSDAAEGIAALLGKRDPTFTGH